MPAVHELQDPVIERLNSHAYAVHAQLEKPFDISRTFFHYVFRIYLDGEFVIRSSVPASSQGIKDAFEDIKRQHRWGAASYV